jgi:L-ascorbate metabolism protein UlaG (beta-lactamase superfamily)
MGGAVAALTCRRNFNVDKAIPCHYGSFPVLDQTAEKFVEGLKGSSTEAVVPKVGKTISI